MALYDEIAAILPALRRFARTAIGRPDAADALILASMDALADVALADDGGPLRLRLFEVLGRAWTESRLVALRRLPARQDALVRVIVSAQPMERAALLLVSVERFSAAEAAGILGLEQAEFDRRLVDARRALFGIAPRRVLIIEDDADAARCIAEVVVEAGHRVCATAETEAGAVVAGAEHLPHLVLADVHLGLGGSGAAAAAAILARIPAGVIYVTAYPDLLEGEVDAPPGTVLPKPFASAALTAAIREALGG